MSDLIERAPFSPRDEELFLAEMRALTRSHLERSLEFRRMWPAWNDAARIVDLPFVHVGVFKHLTLRSAGVSHERTLRSSGTTGSSSSIVLDAESSALQAASSLAILADFVGRERVPLLVIDHASSLRTRDVSARVAAAMSLRPLATDILFLQADRERSDSVRWDVVLDAASRSDHLRVYGFTSALWSGWAALVPDPVRAALSATRVDFVHSGGWKKLEGSGIDRPQFDRALLRGLGPGSRVVDYYGLVEQVGVIFPLCEEGYRHVPVWADVVVRDARSLEPLRGKGGLLQLMNVLARGAPYHNVLTEDLGSIVEGDCSCGREGRRFELLGRVPKAELRGCANV